MRRESERLPRIHRRSRPVRNAHLLFLDNTNQAKVQEVNLDQSFTTDKEEMRIVDFITGAVQHVEREEIRKVIDPSSILKSCKSLSQYIIVSRCHELLPVLPLLHDPSDLSAITICLGLRMPCL